MQTLLLLEMATSGHGERVAVAFDHGQLTYDELLGRAWAAVDVFEGAANVAYVAPSHLAFPIALFGSAAAGVPLIPLNYRLPDAQIDALLREHDDVLVIAEEGLLERLAAAGHRVMSRDALVEATAAGAEPGESPAGPDDVALLLYTSGTTSAPKAAVLRHRHLTSYVIGTVEFGGAGDEEAVLVSVPPYHIAGVANLLSNSYTGRRIVYLDRFDAEDWLATVRAEQVTHAMVVPTMLARLCDALEGATDAGTPTLRAMSYGGARTPAPVLRRVMELFPDTGLTNAYGLTETSSTIAVLGPDDHRTAFTSDDPAVQAWLSSVGRVLPTVEIEVRAPDGTVLGPGAVGEVFVRGEQVSGEYAGRPSATDDDGWFATRDRGSVDAEGFLYIEGRSDDTIIRGGENVAPAEIEEVVLTHPAVAECAVVGVPDDEWGQRIAAVVVLRAGEVATAEDVRAFVRERLRGSKTPDTVTFVDELPYTETGKLLRRVVLDGLVEPA